MPLPRVALIEFPADDTDRALAFWGGVLETELDPRGGDEGQGWVTRPDSKDGDEATLGVHGRGPGPGDTVSLPYLEVDDAATTAERVTELGGTIIHPGDRWTICKDSEGNPFALAQRPAGTGDARA
jgi:predicted enzyme related to lactoylglutathione lyase